MKKKKRKKQSFLAENRYKILVLVLITGLFSFTIIMTEPEEYDPRPDRLEAYFNKWDMPFAGHGHVFVDSADHYNIDWRLLPAIGVQESSGGKYMMNNNPFGWGSARIPYTSFDHAIWEVQKHISGNGEETAKWYNTTSTERKLYFYNGTVQPSYPSEVMWIMEQF